MKKTFAAILILLSILYVKSSYQNWYHSDYFRFIVFNIGQGDSMLIVTPNGQTILIDGGPDASVLRGLGDTLPMWLHKIDLIILTHAHDDHINGLIQVLNRYEVNQVLINDSGYNSPSAQIWRNMLAKYKINVINAKEGMVFNFTTDCSLKVLSAPIKKSSDENNYSIISNFSCLGKNILLTGDAGFKIQESLFSNQSEAQVDILKISHHGSLTGTSLKLLEAIRPNIAVISVSSNNSFGHPNQDVLNYLLALAIHTLRTDTGGELYFLANNKSIILKK